MAAPKKKFDAVLAPMEGNRREQNVWHERRTSPRVFQPRSSFVPDAILSQADGQLRCGELICCGHHFAPGRRR
jgi:hypothetical protein